MNEKVYPRIVLSDEDFKIAEFWGRRAAERSIEIRRGRGDVLSSADVDKEFSNHGMSTKAECAVDVYLHRGTEKAVENSALFCRGSSFEPLLPDNLMCAVFDYDSGEQIGDCIGIEVKSTRRKESREALNLVIKVGQFRDYQVARGNGMFDAFVYVLTVTVRDHPNAVDIVGFAREKELEKSVATNNNPNEYGQPTIHYLNLHPMKFLTHKHYKTSKTLRYYT